MSNAVWNPKCPHCRTDRWVPGTEVNASLDPRSRICVDCGSLWIAMPEKERESLVEAMLRRKKAETQ